VDADAIPFCQTREPLLRDIGRTRRDLLAGCLLFQPLCSKASFGRDVYCLAPTGSSL